MSRYPDAHRDGGQGALHDDRERTKRVSGPGTMAADPARRRPRSQPGAAEPGWGGPAWAGPDRDAPARRGTVPGEPARGRSGQQQRASASLGPGGRGRGGAGRGTAARPGRRWGGLPAIGGSYLLTWAAIGVTTILVIASLSAYVAYRNVYDSIHHDDVTAAMLGKRPPKFDGSVNILVVGSDSRTGTHGKYGTGIDGARSDTSLLLHLSPDHKKAVVISFPRDSMVPVLKCLPDGQGHPGQQAQPGQSEMLNSAYSYGGAACLWHTLEQTTGIFIDHFAEVNFAGFQSIVNDVGGVKVCLPFAIKDPASGLDLTAGVHNVTGAQALAFVRERHIGYGSDLQRIQRQQYFLASAMQKVKQTNILSNPQRIYSVVHDVAKSLTTDSGLTLQTMAAIAGSAQGLSSGGLQFVSVPVVPDPADPLNRVDWAQPDATQLFSAVAHDTKLPKVSKSKHAKSAASKPATISPAKVQVNVLNGSGTEGLAGTTATGLTGRGFTVIGTGNAPGTSYTSTIIQYGPASDVALANTLKAQLGQADVQQSASVQPGTVSLILGSDFTGLPSPKAKASSSAMSSLSKDYGGISASTNICQDSAAFAGPDTPSMFTP
jgi:LCP family protein required for cell wall assembly